MNITTGGTSNITIQPGGGMTKVVGDLQITGEILGSEDHYTAYSNTTIAISNSAYTIIDYNKLISS